MYRLAELGWLQFERLCDELLGLPADVWEGRADTGRSAVRPDGVVVTVEWQPRPRVLVGGEEVDVQAALDARPELRRRCPFVLGVRDLEELATPAALARSTGDVEAARELARVFVPTRAYARTLDALERHRFAVVTGPPEMGKTAIARTIGLALLTEGWELHECTRPEQLWQRFDRDRRQVFVADDAFGSTEYRPEAAERWALDLDRVLRAMDERHRLIWTSRPSPLAAGLRRIHREHGVERFPQPAQVQVEASALDVEEKALILFRHARAAGLDRRATDLVRRYGWTIVEHPHFTPERIRRFVADRLPTLARVGDRLRPREVAEAVAAEIREPTAAMRSSLRALPPEHRALLVALLDVPPGAVQERDLAAAARRHAPDGLPRPPAELLDRLTDHFVRRVPPASVTWVHPSWRDLVIDELAADAAARRDFLEQAGLDGLLLALSVAGGEAGERALPLLVADEDWDALGDRIHALVPELADDELFRLLATVREALRATGGATWREAAAIAGEALAVTARRWAHDPVPVSLADAWLALAARTPDAPEPPPLARTWIELLPTAFVDVTDRGALVELDEWLRFAEVLEARAPAALATFGFPGAQSAILERLLADAWKLDPSAPTQPLVAQALVRLERAAPELATRARLVAARRAEAAEVDAGPGSAERPAPPPEISIVARILDDLSVPPR